MMNYFRDKEERRVNPKKKPAKFPFLNRNPLTIYMVP